MKKLLNNDQYNLTTYQTKINKRKNNCECKCNYVINYDDEYFKTHVDNMIKNHELDYLKPIFSMPEQYRNVTVPDTEFYNLYTESQFVSSGKYQYPSGFTCNYLSWTQTLGSSGTSLIEVIENPIMTDIWFQSAYYIYKVNWTLSSFVDINDDPNLKVVISDENEFLYEAFDINGKRIILNYPTRIGQTTSGTFSLYGWNNVFLIMSLLDGFQMELTINAIEIDDKLPNPYKIGTYYVNVNGIDIPAYEISVDEYSEQYLRTVYQPFTDFAKQTYDEYRSILYAACIVPVENNTLNDTNLRSGLLTAQNMSSITFELRPDVREVTKAEKACVLILTLGIVVFLAVTAAVAAVVFFGLPLLFSTIGVVKFMSLLNLGAFEASALTVQALFSTTLYTFMGSVFLTQLALAVSGPSLISYYNNGTSSLTNEKQVKRSGGIQAYQDTYVRRVYCLNCGVSLYVDCAFMNYMNNPSDSFITFRSTDGNQKTPRIFSINRNMGLKIDVSIRINFARLTPRHIIKGIQCQSGPYFGLESNKSGRPYLCNELHKDNPFPVPSYSSKVVSYLFSTAEHGPPKNGIDPGFDYHLDATYQIQHDPGHEKGLLSFTLRNAAVIMGTPELGGGRHDSMSTNPLCRMVYPVIGNIGRNVYDDGKSTFITIINNVLNDDKTITSTTEVIERNNPQKRESSTFTTNTKSAVSKDGIFDLFVDGQSYIKITMTEVPYKKYSC